jgi:hypothetical protein
MLAVSKSNTDPSPPHLPVIILAAPWTPHRPTCNRILPPVSLVAWQKAMDIGIRNTYERVKDERNIDVAGCGRHLGPASGLYPAETGRLYMNAECLSGDKQKRQCRSHRRIRKTTIRISS